MIEPDRAGYLCSLGGSFREDGAWGS